MKKILLIIIGFLCLWNVFASIDGYTVDEITPIKWTDNNVVNTGLVTWDPLREWSMNPWTKLKETLNTPQLTTSQAKWDTLSLIKWIINYGLGLLWLIALVYLIIHWFMMVTAAWNDEKYKKWFQWVKYWTIALLGIWVSWFIVSLILYLIYKIAF